MHAVTKWSHIRENLFHLMIHGFNCLDCSPSMSTASPLAVLHASACTASCCQRAQSHTCNATIQKNVEFQIGGQGILELLVEAIEWSAKSVRLWSLTDLALHSIASLELRFELQKYNCALGRGLPYLRPADPS